MYRIIKETPPPSKRGAPGGGSLTTFLHKVEAEAPGEWVLLDKKRKYISYLYNLRNASFPNMEIVTRKNKDGTFGVWIRFHDAPVEKARRASTIAKGQA